MNVANAFKAFLNNIAVDNADTISLRYGEVTRALNMAFRDSESRTANSLQVGSYGRWTAIKGVSDLDMLYIVPNRFLDTYNINGGQSALLRDTAQAIRSRYPSTTIRVDRLVVCAMYTDFHVEVQPVFEQADGSFKYPDSYDGGSWKITRPREEIAAMSEANATKNSNLRRLCKVARAWKNKHGVAMGGLLIDTLAHNFLNSTTEYDETSYNYYGFMSRDFFAYLAAEPDKERYAALGSGQHVKVKKKFQKKAKKAHDLCLKAIEAGGTDGEADKWRKIYGREFPSDQVRVAKAFVVEAGYSARDTEEFIEDKFPVDIRYDIQLDCRVTQSGFRPASLSEFLSRGIMLKANKSLEFYVTSQNIEGPFVLYWKVKNRGVEAIRRDMVRGQIVADAGQHQKTEATSFRGDHVVECYAVQEGVVVAKARIHVPIEENA